MLLTIAYIETNVFAVFVLILIAANSYSRGEVHFYEQKLFLTLVFFDGFMLLLDSFQWLLNGMPGSASRTVMLVLSTVYACLTPLPCFFWSVYADYKIHKDENRLRRFLFPMLLPIIVNAIFAVLSDNGGYIFYLDRNNFYHRGSFFFILAVACYIYLMCTMIVVVAKRKIIPKKDFASLLLFAVFPYAGGIIQCFFYGVSLVWVCVTLAILMIFLNLQNSQMYTDHLTGLCNRKQLDAYLREWMRGKSGKMLAGILIDIDSFKTINDQWGHDAGDEALVQAAKILEKSFTKDDLLCRYGGDEFVVMLHVKDRSELLKCVESLRENAKKHNALRACPYEISFSIGCDLYEQDSDISFRDFFRQIDELMYEDKRSKNKAEFS